MRQAIGAVLAVVLLTACGGSQAPVDPARTLRDAATAMGKLNTVKAELKFTKGAISFQGFTLVQANTSVRLPGDSDTVYTVKQGDLAISLEVVIVGGHVYLHLPFSTYQELQGSQAAAIPDLAKLVLHLLIDRVAHLGTVERHNGDHIAFFHNQVLGHGFLRRCGVRG